MKQILIVVFIIFNISITVAEDLSLCQKPWSSKITIPNDKLKFLSLCIKEGNLTKEIQIYIYRNIAKIYHAKNNNKEAIKYYTKAINLHPKDIKNDYIKESNANDYIKRGNAWDVLGDYKKALQDYNKSFNIIPDFPEAYFNIGLIYAQMGYNDKALSYYAKASKLGLTSNKFYGKKRLLLFNQSSKNAIIYFKSLEILVYGALKNCQSTLTKDKAWRKELIKRWNKKNYKYLVASHRWLKNYKNNLLKYNKNIGQINIENIENTIKKNGIDKLAYFLKNEQKNGTKVCNEFEKNILKGVYDISQERAYYKELNSLLPYLSTSFYKDVVNVSSRQLENNKNFPKKLYYCVPDKNLVQTLRIGIIADKKHYLAFFSDISSIMNLLEKDANLFHGISLILQIDTKKMVADGYTFIQDKNGKWFTKEIPSNYISVLKEVTLARAYRNIGMKYHRNKENKKAIEYYTKAISLQPKDVENDYLNRANAWDDAGDYKKALLDYNQSLRIVPNFPNAYSNMGLVYTRMGDDNKALFYYAKAYKFGLRSQNFYSNVNLFMVNKIRKDAVIFLYSLKIFIKSTSKYCQPLLQKDDNWSNNLIDVWVEKNKKYLESSTKWLNKYFNSSISYAKQIGLEKKEEVLNRMEKEAIIKMNNLRESKSTKDIGIRECKQFEDAISKGTYNITSKIQYYKELENLLPPVSSIVYEDIFKILEKESKKNK